MFAMFFQHWKFLGIILLGVTLGIRYDRLIGLNFIEGGLIKTAI